MCLNPNYAIYFKNKDPKKPGKMKFLPIRPETNYRLLKEKYQDNLISLPCGQCEECRKDYATQWAIRCALEASKYEHNWFITLTYDNHHYRDLNKEDIQEFFYKLDGKKHTKRNYKYWLAGEYGNLSKRAHYHLILFNYDIKATPLAKSQLGNTIWKSDLISKAWGKGYVEIQEAGDNAMAYCAKYATKTAKEVGFKPMMSKGLGLSELERNRAFINKYGYIQGQAGKKYKIPRYYFKKFFDKGAQKLKEKQIAKGKRKTAENARYNHLEIALLNKAKELSQVKGRRAKVWSKK